MKERLKRIFAGIIAVYVIFASLPPITVNAAPASYSTSSNSGTRDEVCTTLDGTGASSYYTGNYTYDKLSDMTSAELKTALNELMSDTHTYKTSYDDCKNKYVYSDCQENDTNHLTTIYTSYEALFSDFDGGSGWNREHVWPKSLGGFGNSGAGSDLHHIRPSENKTNSKRDNLKYGNVTGGSTVSGNLSGIVGGSYNSSYYEPLDNVKGDVARIILYVHVRYYDEYSECGSVTAVFQSIDVLLEWCALDPVDTWEMGRNEVVGKLQGNRNVFIDYPELAWQLFGREAPENMTTPSMNASSGNVGSGGNGSGNSGSGNGGSGDVVQPTVTDIATIKAASSGNYTTEGIVVARNAQSYLIADETGVIMVFVKAMPEVEIGDKLRVSGDITVYGGATQFANGAVHTKLGTESVDYPTPTNLTGAACDAYLNALSLDYIKVVGTLSTSGSGTKTYYNLTIDGATVVGSVTYPENTSSLSALLGKEVELTGYVTGITGTTTQYLNFMATSIRENTAVACAHENTKLVGASEAVCGTDGYTGDTYCTACNEKLAAGSVIEATGEHSFGEWTTADGYEERTCTVCGYSEVRNNDCTHVNTELRNVKITSCREAGFTGDTYCKDCGAKLAAGVSVAKTSHTYGDAALVKEATSTEEGISRRVCSVCGDAKDEAIPVKEASFDADIGTVAVIAGVGGVSLIVILILVKKLF